MKDGSAALTKNGASNQEVADSIADIVTYTVKDDGTYELTLQGEWKTQATTASDGSKDTKFVNGKSAFTLNGNTYYATSETVFFVITGSNPADLDEDDYEVYTGYANMPGFLWEYATAANQQVGGFAVVADNDYNKQAEYVYIYAKDLEGISDVDTYFVKKKDADIITNSDGSYYVLPAIVDGEATTVKVDATITDVDDNANEYGLFAVKNVVKDSKGIITRFTNVTNSTTFSAAYGAAGTVEANKVVLGIGSSKASATYWAYDKDTNVYVVDKKYKTITISSVADVETDANDLVYAIKDKDKVLTDVVIVKQDDVALSNKASVDSVKIGGKTVDAYVELSDAITNAKTVETNETLALDVEVTGTAVVERDKDYSTGSFTKDDVITGWSTFSATNTDGNYTVLKITVTSEDGSNTVTKYVAVKAVAMNTLTITTNNSRVLVNGTLYTAAVKVPANTTVSLTITPADGYKVTKVEDSSSNTLVGYSGVYDYTVSADATITVTTATI